MHFAPSSSLFLSLPSFPTHKGGKQTYAGARLSSEHTVNPHTHTLSKVAGLTRAPTRRGPPVTQQQTALPSGSNAQTPSHPKRSTTRRNGQLIHSKRYGTASPCRRFHTRTVNAYRAEGEGGNSLLLRTTSSKEADRLSRRKRAAQCRVLYQRTLLDNTLTAKQCGSHRSRDDSTSAP